MAETDWKAFAEQTTQRLGELGKAMPGPAKGFSMLTEAATAPGALDPKTKELIALAIGISARCDGCIAYHSNAAKKSGATREEVVEAISVAVYMGGGPSMIYGAEALSCYDALD